MRVGNLVTVVEEADFTAVAQRPASLDAGAFAGVKRDCAGVSDKPTFDRPRGCERGSGRLACGEKVQSGKNFLYPTGLFIASKTVGPLQVGCVARRARLPGGSERNQCQRL